MPWVKVALMPSRMGKDGKDVSDWLVGWALIGKLEIELGCMQTRAYVFGSSRRKKDSKNNYTIAPITLRTRTHCHCVLLNRLNSKPNPINHSYTVFKDSPSQRGRYISFSTFIDSLLLIVSPCPRGRYIYILIFLWQQQ